MDIVGEADRVDGAVPVRNGGLSVEKTIKFGVIGCGLMGREFASASMRWLHLQTDLPRPQIIAACSRTDKSLDWFRRVPDTRYFYHDYHELLENPEVEAVYCAVPHDQHAQIYTDIIRSGKIGRAHV